MRRPRVASKAGSLRYLAMGCDENFTSLTPAKDGAEIAVVGVLAEALSGPDSSVAREGAAEPVTAIAAS